MPFCVIVYKLLELAGEDALVRLRKAFLICASVVYLLCFGIRHAAALAASIVFNYAAWCVMEKINVDGAQDRHRKGHVPRKRTVAACAIAINVACLLVFKLTRFPMPMGISFYTFTQVAFLADALRGEAAVASFPDYLLHALFFPRFLQGPIVRYADTREMILSRLGRKVRAEHVLNGALLFSLGLGKKVLLADLLAREINFAYGVIPDLTRPDALLTILIYPMMLYFDFSAYCDMGMGVCRMMALDLPDNFRTPLRAASVAKLWKRWHISLTAFFTRYVYIPLGGNRKGEARRCLNTLIVFALSAFWHGTGWGFMIWGMMHGIALLLTARIDRVIDPLLLDGDGRPKHPVAALCQAVRVLLCYVYVCATYVFFRADSLQDAFKLFERTYGALVGYVSGPVSATFALDEVRYAVRAFAPDNAFLFRYGSMITVLAAGAVVLFAAPRAKDIADRITREASGLPGEKGSGAGMALLGICAVLCAALFVWSLISSGGVSTYVYVNF